MYNPVFFAQNFIAAVLSFPASAILDSFNRADTGPPPSASWTSTWEPGSAGHSVVSNVCLSASGNSTTYWNTTFGPNVEVYTKVATSSISYLQLAARLINVGTSNVSGYLLSTTGGNLEVYRIDNDAYTLLGASISQTVSNGDSIGMSIVGSTITVWYKSGAGSWTNMGTRTDSNYSGAGKIGIRSGSSNDKFDDFGGGTI
jgi:hypothetical protein